MHLRNRTRAQNGASKHDETEKPKASLSARPVLLLVGLVTVGHPQHRKAEASCEMDRPTADIFPLDAVSSTFPADVDVRLTNAALPARLYCSLCQMVREPVPAGLSRPRRIPPRSLSRYAGVLLQRQPWRLDRARRKPSRHHASHARGWGTTTIYKQPSEQCAPRSPLEPIPKSE